MNDDLKGTKNKSESNQVEYEDLATVYETFYREKASLVKAILEERGIKCYINNYLSEVKGTGGGALNTTLPAQIQVVKSDVENATNILEENKDYIDEFVLSGSEDKITLSKRIMSIVVLFILAILLVIVIVAGIGELH